MLRSPLSALLHLAQGVVIGLANLIPGVSGGTMALILGIYERLVGTMSDGVGAALLLARLKLPQGLERLRALPWLFLGPLALGVVATPFLGAGILEELLETSPVAMKALFLGLIIGSLPIPWVRITRRTNVTWLLMAAGAAAAWYFSGLSAGPAVDPSLLRVFLTAVVAISAMVLPGVSGSFLLLVLGMYAPTLRALDSLDMTYLAVFAAGAGVGLGGFAVLLNWLLKHYHDATMAVLFGLMIGSLRALWPWAGEAAPSSNSLLLLAAGIVATGALTAWEMRRKPASDG